jgi:signal transduction histidine kinase
MAEQIEHEISLRKQSEDNRKQLILDISHDLKNPLASVIGYAELCRDNPNLTQTEREAYLKVISENSLRANRLITDLFELSKMESSEFVSNKTSVDVCEFIREEMVTAISILEQAKFTYDFYIPEEEIMVQLDIEQMGRVFQNLLANALQYNSPGTNITLDVFRQDGEVFILFQDNGIGIPAEIADKIFQPFVRADRARNSRTGGSGLGLAIVEKLIAAHGGTITLKTAENDGCEFMIRLPEDPGN